MNRNIKKTIGFCLDASGSMSNGKTEMIQSYNAQLEEIKNHREEVQVSFMRMIFNASNSTSVDVWDGQTDDIALLTKTEYRTRGSTPLYDAIMNLIKQMESSNWADDPANTFLVVIFSDGKENASRQYKQENVAAKIDELQKTGLWTFAYVGTEHDITQALKMNIYAGNTAWYKKSRKGFTGMTSASCHAIGKYMTSVDRDISNFYGSGLQVNDTDQIGQSLISS